MKSGSGLRAAGDSVATYAKYLHRKGFAKSAGIHINNLWAQDKLATSKARHIRLDIPSGLQMQMQML